MLLHAAPVLSTSNHLHARHWCMAGLTLQGALPHACSPRPLREKWYRQSSLVFDPFPGWHSYIRQSRKARLKSPTMPRGVCAAPSLFEDPSKRLFNKALSVFCRCQGPRVLELCFQAPRPNELPNPSRIDQRRIGGMKCTEKCAVSV